MVWLHRINKNIKVKQAKEGVKKYTWENEPEKCLR